MSQIDGKINVTDTKKTEKYSHTTFVMQRKLQKKISFNMYLTY